MQSSTSVLLYYCTTTVLLYYYCTTIKVATLPRVQAFDHANPWEGLRVARKGIESSAQFFEYIESSA